MASPYAQGSGGGSPYAQRGSGGSPYAQSVKAGKPAKKGGGFLHALGQTVTDVKNMAVNLPGGAYHVGRAYVHDVKKNPEIAWALPLYAGYATATGKGQVGKIGRGMISATEHDLRHPLRHPGYTATDLLGIADIGAGVAARAAEVGRVAKAGRASEVPRAALRGPKPEPRFVTAPDAGEKIPAGTYSKAASTRAVQKGLDRLRERFPEAHIGFRNQAQRVGHAMDTNARFEEDLRRAPANQLIGAGKRLRQPQKLALRVVAEEVPLKQRIAHAEEMLKEADVPRIKRNLQNHLKLLKQVEEYVHDVNGVPRFRPEQDRLIQVFEKSKALADKTEQSLIESKVLTAKGAAERKAMPSEIIRSDLHQRNGFNPDLVPEVFGNQRGFYVTYKHQRVPGSIERPARLGSPESIGIPRKPSQLTHQFEGTTLRQGEVNPETEKLVAQHYLQTSRFLRLWHQRHELAKIAKDQPTSKYDIPIRPIWLKQGWPAEVRAHMHNLDQPLTPEESTSLVQKLHDAVLPKHPTQEEINSGGVKWVDKRELGSINRPGPLAGTSANPGFAKTMSVVDTINQAEKTATIYLRLGHILTRGANNFVFNLVQQGFLAPKNLARSARISTTLSKEAAHRLDAVMGEGYIRSLGNVGPGKLVTGKVQRFYEKFVDLPFRRASFLHEAAREGFKSAKDVTRLLTDGSEHDALLRVVQRANSEIIDYARLGPVERDFIRRIVFIYPWMKGATIYGGHFLGEHPLQAMVYGQLGQGQARRNEKELGSLPSYLQGIFKVGGSKQSPTIVNPKVINQFGTPADVLEALEGAVTGHPEKAYQLREFLMPAYAAAAGENSTGKNPPKGVEGFLRGLYNQTPEYLLAQRLLHPPAKSGHPRIYPYTRREALLQYFAGSTSPHHLNRARANAAAYKEKHPTP